MPQPISEAIEGRHFRGNLVPPSVLFVWPGKPGWRFAHTLASLHFDLRELLGNDVQLVKSGPGCFYAQFRAPSTLTYDFFKEKKLHIRFKEIKTSYNAEKLRLELPVEHGKTKKITVH